MLEEHGEQVKQAAHRMRSDWVLCVCCRSGCKGNSKRWWSVKAGAVGKHSRNAWTWAYPPPTYWPRKVSHLLVTCGNSLCLRKELLIYILKYIYIYIYIYIYTWGKRLNRYVHSQIKLADTLLGIFCPPLKSLPAMQERTIMLGLLR